MANELTSITKVEIKGLWDKYNLEWNLDRGVNILSGANGSGKSTILSYINYILKGEPVPSHLDGLIKEITIRFNNNDFITRSYEKEDFESAKEKFLNDEAFSEAFKKRALEIGSKDKNVTFIKIITPDTIKGSICDNLNVNYINTFDNLIPEVEAVKKISNNTVKSQLDLELFYVINKYLEFRINVTKEMENFLAVFKSMGTPKLQKILEQFNEEDFSHSLLHTKFLTMINEIFLESNKKVDDSSTNLTFLRGEDKLSAFSLSSGEKQMLFILITVLLQRGNKSILILDEPEISLHFDWQRKLINLITTLNPEAQILLSTHSPAIIIEGWSDKVQNVKDLIVANA